MAVGLVNGVFLLLEAHIERMNFGTYMEEYTLPTLGVVMCPKDAKSSIINIKFSYKGDFLVVSFNNEYAAKDFLEDAEDDDGDNPITQMRQKVKSKDEEKVNAKTKKDPSFVLIYVNK